MQEVEVSSLKYLGSMVQHLSWVYKAETDFIRTNIVDLICCFLVLIKIIISLSDLSSLNCFINISQSINMRKLHFLYRFSTGRDQTHVLRTLQILPKKKKMGCWLRW